MTKQMTGRCQCGDVQYKITGEPVMLMVCHCQDCQKQSGSAFGMTLMVKSEAFELTSGDVKTFSSKSDAGRGKTTSFCPTCGTRIFNTVEVRPDMVTVKPGTLDDTKWLKPQLHSWTKRKQDWVEIPGGVKIFEEQPG